MLRISLLGVLHIEVDDVQVAAPSSRRARLLLAILALERRSHSRETLAARLWPGVLDESARASLHTALAQLRAALGPDAGRFLHATPERVALAGPDLVWTDAGELERLLAEGQVKAALELWGGELLTGLVDDWLCECRDELREQLGEALGRAAWKAETDGDLQTALLLTRRHAMLDPLAEEPQRELMRRLACAGDCAAALAAFDTLSVRLREQLRTVPSAATRELAAAVRAGTVPSGGAAVAREPRGDGAGIAVIAAETARGLPTGEPVTPLQRGAIEASRPDSPQSPVPMPSALVAAARGTFVGRAADLEWLAGVYAQVDAGTRRLVLLCGEPGIGKTRLATECSLRAHDDGAIVLYGRCEEEALLGLQPFVEALRHYVSACPSRDLAGRLPISGELRRIVPELADRIPGLPEPLTGDPEGARSRLFEAVSTLLCEAAQSTPVVLVLDDLQWADTATLLLLKSVVRFRRQARLLVVGTYRETELDINHPLSATLAELGRERLLQRRALAPLDAAAVSQLVGVHVGDEPSAELRRLVYEGTEGNAFFVVEVLRDLAESGALGDPYAEPDAGLAPGRPAVPERVKDVIGQRIARLGPEIIRLLTTASVLGQEFELEVLEHLSDLGEEELVDRLDSALRARVIEDVGGAVGRFRFSHGLIRETLYGGLTATRRALLHRRTGAALELAHADAPQPYLSELAYHFAQGGSSGDLDKAIEYGARAGEQAISLLAYEQAAEHFRQTAQLIAAAEPDHRQRRRCDVVIAQGEAERQAGDPGYRQTLLDGAGLAQELHDPERLARAALANNRGFFSSAQGVDRDRVAVLHAALDAYDNTDSPTRAALLSLLAFELVTDPDWRAREKLSDEALAMARRIGDPRTLALVLTQRCLVQWTPQTLPELRPDLREAGELAAQLDDPLLAGHAAYLGANAAMDVADLGECDRALARLSAVAEQLGQPLMRWYAGVAHAKRRLISGPAEEAEQLAFAALELGRSADQPDSMVWFIGQLYAARFLQGALNRRDPHLPDLFDTAASWLPATPEITPSRSLPLLLGAVMSATFAEVGRLDDAHRQLELLMSELDELPHDYSALAIPAFASVACARLGDTGIARRLHAMLEPHSHDVINAGPPWLGAATHYLGLLAATLNHPDEADARFAAAERTYVSLDAKPWLTRLHNDWTSR